MTTPTDGRALLDTNVLVYASDGASPHHVAATAVRDAGAAGRLHLHVTPQVLFEYVSVITNPKRVAAPRTPADAWAEVAKLTAVFPLVLPPLNHMARGEVLARQVRHRGAEVFDLAIAATMLAAGIQEIFTFDGEVFGRVPGVIVRTP